MVYSADAVTRPRRQVMCHMLSGKNFGLITTYVMKDGRDCSVSDSLIPVEFTIIKLKHQTKQGHYLLKAVQNPEWIETAQENYRKAKAMPQDAVDHRKEMQALDRALEQLGQEQAAAVKAQIAGIMQGASPDAYAEVFADIAARRKDMAERRGALNRAAKVQKSAGMVRQEAASRETFLRDVQTSLTSPHITEAEKRALVGRVVEKVVCQKDGANVVFMPGLFGEVCFQAALDTKPSVLTACASYLGL